jgi:hypothetical protein
VKHTRVVADFKAHNAVDLAAQEFAISYRFKIFLIRKKTSHINPKTVLFLKIEAKILHCTTSFDFYMQINPL